MHTKNAVSAASQMTRRFVAVTAALVAMFGLALSSQGSVLVSNTFNTGSDDYPAYDDANSPYSEMGTDYNTSGDLESAWFEGGSGTLNPVGPGGPLRGDQTGTAGSSSTWTTYFTPEGSEVNLLNTGDSLKITWVFSLSNVNANNTSQNFRLAVVDTPGAARLTVNGAPGSAAYTGYAMFMNMGQTLGNSNPYQLREYFGGNSALLSASGTWNALTNTVSSGATGYAASTTYTYTMTLTRTGGGLSIVSTMAGGSVGGTGTMTDTFEGAANGGSYQFDTFSLRPSGESTTASIFDTSLFMVEFTPIPEPSTLLLVGIGLVGLLVGGRRLRR